MSYLLKKLKSKGVDVDQAPSDREPTELSSDILSMIAGGESDSTNSIPHLTIVANRTIPTITVVASIPQPQSVTDALQSAGVGIKPSANVGHLNPAIVEEITVIAKAFTDHGTQAVITSGNDSQHTTNSKHYTNNAIDLRANDITATTAQQIVSELKSTLPSNFFVQFEQFTNPANNHIHIQYNGQ